MSKTENILVFGGTGYIGTYILSDIIASKSAFKRIALFTSSNTVANKSSHIESLKAQGVDIIVGDVQKEEDVLQAYQGIDTIVSCVGRAAIDYQLLWIKLASQTPSIKRFFPSEYGTDIEYKSATASDRPHHQKQKVRAFLETAKDLEYTYVVTGPYADGAGMAYLSACALAPETGSFDVKGKKAVIVGDGKGKISLTTPPDVGKLVVAALLHPTESRNRALHVNSFTTTDHEILAGFEKQTGGEKWAVSYTPQEKLQNWEKEAYEKGVPYAVLFSLKLIWNEGGTLYEKRDNELIGAENMQTVEDAVKKAVQQQVGGSKI